MDKAALLQNLRSCIPEFDCIPGCTACCGHVPWSEHEYNQLSEQEKATFDRFTLKCPFVGDGRCTIHDKRPMTCRIFAVTEGLPCPRGVRAKAIMDTETVTVVMKQYDKHFFRGDET
jgi:hypothetical protein